MYIHIYIYIYIYTLHNYMHSACPAQNHDPDSTKSTYIH